MHWQTHPKIPNIGGTTHPVIQFRRPVFTDPGEKPDQRSFAPVLVPGFGERTKQICGVRGIRSFSRERGTIQIWIGRDALKFERFSEVPADLRTPQI